MGPRHGPHTPIVRHAPAKPWRASTSWPEGREIVDEYVTYLERQCARHDGQIMIAEVETGIAGFVAVVAATRGDAPDDSAVHAWVHDVFVRPEHRRRGIGTALMRAAEAFAHDRGATELRLAVLARNVDAHALYRRLDFRDYARVLTKPLGGQASGAGSSVRPIR